MKGKGNIILCSYIDIMSRGFTLIELLAVIVILAIILALVVPNIFDIINNSENDIYYAKEQSLEKAAYDYVLFSKIDLPSNINDQTIINANDIIENNFATKIYDLENSDYECSGYVIVKKINNYNYDYNSCIFCEEYQTSESYCDISLIQ